MRSGYIFYGVKLRGIESSFGVNFAFTEQISLLIYITWGFLFEGQEEMGKNEFGVKYIPDFTPTFQTM